MRPLYTKFSLVFLFFLLLHLNTPRAMSLIDVASVKETTKPIETKPTIKPSTGNGRRNNRPAPTKAKRLAIPANAPKPNQELRSFTTNIESLTPKGMESLNIKPAPEESVGPDPFRFTLTADKDSVAVGEEIELTVAVEWVDYGVNNGVSFLPEWYKYTLKVVLPKGFIQTGGDYIDYCSKSVDALNPIETFTIKGKFEYRPEDPKFTVLRGFEGANEKSEFIWKGEKLFQIKDFYDYKDFVTKIKSDKSSRTTDVTIGNIKFIGSSIVSTVPIDCGDFKTTITQRVQNVSSSAINNILLYLHATNIILANNSSTNRGCYSSENQLLGFVNPSVKFNLPNSTPIDILIEFKHSEVIRDVTSKVGAFKTLDFNHADGLIDNASWTCSAPISFTGISFSAETLPVTTTPINYEKGAQATVLSATPVPSTKTLKWYDSGNNLLNNAPTPSTSTIGQTIYYVSQTDGTCESSKVKITVNVIAASCATTITKPILDSPTNGCDKVTLKISNATYKSDHTYKWQKSTNGTTGWSDITGATSQTYDVTVKSYYRVVASQSTCSSTSDATTEITPPTVLSPPSVTTPQTFTVNQVISPLTATVTTGSTNVLKWYDGSGTALNSAPTPSTTTVGSTDFYVSQTLANGTCESGKSKIVVDITACTAALPTLSGSTSGCSSVTLSYTAQSGHTYQWKKKNTNNTWDNVTITNGYIDASGDYKLIATKTSESCSAEDTKTISITGIPSAVSLTDITGNVSASCDRDIVLSTSGCTTYYWEQDGSATSETGASFSVTVPTINSVIKVYCGTSGCHSTTYKTATVNVSSVTTPTLTAKTGTNLWNQNGTNTVKLQTTGCSVGALKWYKGTTEITPTLTSEDSKITASFSSVLDAGKYKVSCGCTLSNEVELINSSLCGSLTAPTYKNNGIPVSEITGLSGTTIEIEATCANGGAFSWTGTNQPTLKAGNIYYVAITGSQVSYNAQCAISGCTLDNDLIAKSSACDASDPTFSYNPNQSVANGTQVTITGACTSGGFSWSDGTAGASRTETITPSYRSFSAKCTRSSGCYNEKSADLYVGCDAPTPNFSSNPASFPVREGQAVTITGNCDGNSTFRWADGTAGVSRTIYPNDDATVGGSCFSNTIANCNAYNTFSVTVSKRTGLTLNLIAKDAICGSGVCDGKISATIGNRENNYKFAYYLLKKDATGNWIQQSFIGANGTVITGQADWFEKYDFTKLPKGEYRVDVKDYFYAGDDSRDFASATVEIKDVVCPSGGNYAISANKYCLDGSNPNDEVVLQRTGCTTGTINWWKDLSAEGGNWIALIDPNFNPDHVKQPGRYKAVCETDVCPHTRNEKAWSNAVEIIASGKTAPIVVAVNNKTQVTAPELYYNACTSNSSGNRSCERIPIYQKYNSSGQLETIFSVNQLLGNGIAYFNLNASNTKIPAASVIDYVLGETITVQAAGCATGSYQWSNGATGNYLTFTPTDNTPIIVWCEDGSCKSKYSNAITPNRTSGAFTITSDGNTVCNDNPLITLSSKGCSNGLTVKWFRKQIITPEVPEVQIGTGVTLALSGALTPSFTANYRAECYSGTKLLLDTKSLKITLGSELKLDEISYNNVPQILTTTDITVNPCKDAEVTFNTKGCVGKVRWARNVESFSSGAETDDQGQTTYVPISVGYDFVDIEGKSGFPSFTTRFTTDDVIYVACAGQNPKNNQYICSTTWKKIIVNIRQKSNAKPQYLDYKICENQPLNLEVINKEVGDKTYSWYYYDAFDNAFEYNYRPKIETIANVKTSFTLNDPVVIPKTLAEHSGKWQLRVVNDCGTATTEFKIGVTHFETSINFNYSGNYKNMTFQNASTVGFKRIKKVVSTVKDPKTSGYYEVLVQDKVNTNALWIFKKVISPSNKVEVYRLTQTLLATAGSWDPFTYAFADPGTYEITVQIKDPATSCEVTKIETIEAKCEQPAKPTKPANADVFACLSGTTPVTFNATGCTAAGNVINWYKIDIKDANADVTSIATGPTLSLPLSGFTDVGIFKYRAKCQYGICSSDFSDTYTLTLGKTTVPVAKAIDPKTSVESTALVTAINTRAISLSATGCEYGNITWYRDSDNGVQATGNPIAIKFSDVNVNNAEFKFYAKCTSGTGTNTCTSGKSNLARIMFIPCPAMLPITVASGALTDCGSVTLQIPAGSGDGVYKWYNTNSAFVKATGDKFVATESGTFYYTTCDIGREDASTIPFRKVVTIVKSNPSVTGPIVMGAGLTTPPDAVLTGSDDAPAPPSGYYTIYEWKNISVTTPVVVPGSNSTINPRTVTNGGLGVYELRVKKSTSTNLSATVPAQCIAPVLKTEVYARGAGCGLDFATTNGTVIECDGQAKITVLTNQPTPLPAGAVISYRLDLNDWQTSNVLTNVPYGKHTVSIRMVNGSQTCYATRDLAENLFDGCGKLSCDFRIVAKDDLGVETNTLARDPATKGLKTLKLSVESFDGSNLTNGVTYDWTLFQKGTAIKKFSSAQAEVTIGAIGTYIVKLTRGDATCTAEIAINSKPCLDTPEPTTKCETKALTGVNDEIANRLPELNVGDVVRCGDFNVTIIEATGSPAGWNGKGYVKVPYLNAEVSIILQNAVFNDCYQLTNANATVIQPTVFTEYDPSYWLSPARNFEDINKDLDDNFKNFTGTQTQKDEIDKLLDELCNYYSNDAGFDDNSKSRLNLKCSNLRTLWGQLKGCAVSISSGRVSADACTVTPTQMAEEVGKFKKSLTDEVWPGTWAAFSPQTLIVDKLRRSIKYNQAITYHIWNESSNSRLITETIADGSKIIVNGGAMTVTWDAFGGDLSSPDVFKQSVEIVDAGVNKLAILVNNNKNQVLLTFEDTDQDKLMAKVYRLWNYLVGTKNSPINEKAENGTPFPTNCTDNCAKITQDDLEKVFSNLKKKNNTLRNDFLVYFNEALCHYNLGTELRKEHIFAQFATESIQLKTLIEGKGPKNDDMYNYWTGNVGNFKGMSKSDFYTLWDQGNEAFFNFAYKDKIGNKFVGDGFKFRGRGLIQLTGRANAIDFTKRYNNLYGENINLESDFTLLEQAKYAVRISFLYAFNGRTLGGIIKKKKKKNGKTVYVYGCEDCKGLTLIMAADLDDATCVGLAVNGDRASCVPNGQKDRLINLARIKKIIQPCTE